MKISSKIYNKTNGSLTCVIDGVVYTVDKSHAKFQELLDAFNHNDASTFVDLYSYVEKTTAGVFTGLSMQDGKILYNGTPLHNVLVDTILELKEDGLPIDYMVYFLQNLMANPSSRSIEELYSFLAHKNMPITEDGFFIAYKTVVTYHGNPFTDVHGKTVKDGDLVDKYSRKVRNNIGDSPEMARNQVDDNCNRTCSHGYHVGALKYSGPGGSYNSPSDTVILVKVNPKDVVSVPADHNAQKLRVAKYEVVGTYTEPLGRSSKQESYSYIDDEYNAYNSWGYEDDSWDN